VYSHIRIYLQRWLKAREEGGATPRMHEPCWISHAKKVAEEEKMAATEAEEEGVDEVSTGGGTGGEGDIWDEGDEAAAEAAAAGDEAAEKASAVTLGDEKHKGAAKKGKVQFMPTTDPNGEEAGRLFLQANQAKEGVTTLPSGLQYRVLAEGVGLEHPALGTPCECHYAGRLLDGTEFDSSYKRGTPSTFAPNQVIKGWTEAMQLMVQGDKWEMYIPYGLAYGANGKPPKIPPAAALIFVMEIVKIKGKTTPKQAAPPSKDLDELD